MGRLRWTALALAGALAAAVVAPASAQEVEIKPTAKVKKDRYIITAEEIAERPEIRNGMEAVKLLRSQWLRPVRAKGGGNAGSYGTGQFSPEAGARDPRVNGAPATERPPPVASTAARAGYGDPDSQTGLPVLYIDDVKQESVKELENLPVAVLAQLKFMTYTQASGQYGSGHDAGAILVTTTRATRKP